MDYTESFQLLPEQSTAAIIIHHPEARYFAVRGAAAPREITEKTEASETQTDAKALERASQGEISLAEARADT